MVRKVSEKVDEAQVQEDLERYRQKAIELGATDAKVITTDMVVIDERVRMKCMFPLCFMYGTNINCPPHAIDLEQTRKVVKNFQYGIFTRLQGPSEEFAGPEAVEKNLLAIRHIKTIKIIGLLESMAFFDGYYLAVGFGCGPCKLLFCPDKECSALMPGQGCRHSLRIRASMEGVGMDVFKMATKVGWDVYPIGSAICPKDVPFGATYGLLLIC
jgi:predicted metal-binding protein